MIASIIIPAYNEEKNIGKVLEGIKKTVRGYEIIVIDDGSTDRTADIVKNLGYRCISLKKNMGKGYACRAGVNSSRTKKIIFFDADNQFSAKDIPKFAKALDNYDMAVGTRNRKSMPVQRRFSNFIARKIINHITGRKYNDVLSGFRAIRKDAFLALKMGKNRYEFESEMMIKAKSLRIKEMPVSVCYGGSGMPASQSAKVFFYLMKELIK